MVGSTPQWFACADSSGSHIHHLGFTSLACSDATPQKMSHHAFCVAQELALAASQRGAAEASAALSDARLDAAAARAAAADLELELSKVRAFMLALVLLLVGRRSSWHVCLRATACAQSMVFPLDLDHR